MNDIELMKMFRTIVSEGPAADRERAELMAKNPGLTKKQALDMQKQMRNKGENPSNTQNKSVATTQQQPNYDPYRDEDFKKYKQQAAAAGGNNPPPPPPPPNNKTAGNNPLPPPPGGKTPGTDVTPIGPMTSKPPADKVGGLNDLRAGANKMAPAAGKGLATIGAKDIASTAVKGAEKLAQKSSNPWAKALGYGAAALGGAGIGYMMGDHDDEQQGSAQTTQPSPRPSQQSGGKKGGLTDREEMELNALAFDLEKMAENDPNRSAEIQKMLEPYYKVYGKGSQYD